MMVQGPQALAVDAAQFDRLLAMVGPHVAADLIVQLRADILTAQDHLLAAVPAMDWALIRAQSHVVMGLAGTIGAWDLHRLARQLNDFVQNAAPDRQLAMPLISATVAALNTAFAYLSQHTTDGHGPR